MKMNFANAYHMPQKIRDVKSIILIWIREKLFAGNIVSEELICKSCSYSNKGRSE